MNGFIDSQNDYAQFAMSVEGLSSLEASMTGPLHAFADTAKSYSMAINEMSNQESLLFLSEIHDLLAYCHAAKVHDRMICRIIR